MLGIKRLRTEYEPDPMTVDELRSHLQHLIDTYVPDQIVKADLLSLVATYPVPAKGILAELEASRSGAMSQADAQIINDIAFYFI
jgi:hypothetical protein